uniref:Chromate transporter n=1 Tax=Caenorhabditis tropicalis TaxID=1561998 RepID=A0A1I7UBG0_9PELO
MKNMKIPMLIAHVWSTNLDLCFTVYGAPFAFFPGAAGLPLGTAAVLGMPSKWIVYLGQAAIVNDNPLDCCSWPNILFIVCLWKWLL